MPENSAIDYSRTHNYKDFYENEIKERKQLNYPPFGKIAKLTFVDENAKNAMVKAKKIFEQLNANAQPGVEINLYPSLIFKLHNKYRWNVLIQGGNPSKIIKKLELPSICRIDVDPISIS